jgi:hypothetical protein
MPHKHWEVLQAISFGDETQFSFNGEDWQDSPPSGSLNPITHHYLQWRVKNSKAKEVEVYYYAVSIEYGVPVVSYTNNKDEAVFEIVTQEKRIINARAL